MSRSDVYLNDIWELILRIERDLGKKFYFKKGNLLYDSTLMRLQVIGETIKKLPKEEIAKYPEVKWKIFIRFRDFVSHHYTNVNCSALRKIVSVEIPKLKKAIEELRR